MVDLSAAQSRPFGLPGQELTLHLGPQRPHEPLKGLVVLMHGYGASGRDLVPLARQIPAPPGVRFVFPEAPLELAPGYDARAWWPIDIQALEAAMARGAHRDRSNEEPPELPEISARLSACIADLQAQLGATDKPLVLGGFSQGSMLACDIFSRSKMAISGLMVLSGTLLADARWSEGFKARAGTPVLQTHGSRDPLLAFSHAELLKQRFEAAGAHHLWVPFNGQHELPHSLLGHAEKFLADIFKTTEGGAQ